MFLSLCLCLCLYISVSVFVFVSVCMRVCMNVYYLFLPNLFWTSCLWSRLACTSIIFLYKFWASGEAQVVPPPFFKNLFSLTDNDVFEQPPVQIVTFAIISRIFIILSTHSRVYVYMYNSSVMTVEHIRLQYGLIVGAMQRPRDQLIFGKGSINVI